MKILSLTILLVLVRASTALGCQCSTAEREDESNFATEYGLAHTIATGIIVDINKDVYPVKYLMKTNSVYKGLPIDTLELFSGSGGGDCGYRFELNKSYVVYTTLIDDESLFVSRCSRTSETHESPDQYLLERITSTELGYQSGIIRDYLQYKLGGNIELPQSYSLIYFQGHKISLDQLLGMNPKYIAIELRNLGSGDLKMLNSFDRKLARNGILVVRRLGSDRLKTRKLIRRLNKV